MAALKKGSKGSKVKVVQQQLNAAGYGPITADGDFGAKTDAAVRRFQADRGFTIDGIIGPVTAAALEVAAALGPVIVTDMAVLDDNLKAEYNRLWATCTIAPEHQAEVDLTADQLAAAKARYDVVAKRTAVPWHVIAAIHSLESGQDFNTHLHNGDPLTARTVHVPAGRPVAGNPPFTWEDSAVDALDYDHFIGWTDWSVAGTLYKLERYNGAGYRKQVPPATSAYLWAYTNQHLKGKYVADHVYDPNAIPKHPGAASIFKSMGKKGYATLGKKTRSITIPVPNIAPPQLEAPVAGRRWPKAAD